MKFINRYLPSVKYFYELYIALFIIVGITVGGTFGYMIIEDYSFDEGLYMTVITISTVGFREIRDLSPNGRYFTIILIATSFFTVAYVVSNVSRYIFTGTINKYYRKFKMDNKIHNLKDHIVICGTGNNGMESIRKLSEYKKEMVAIENDPDKIERLKDQNVLYVEGDATDEEVLIEAGIENAGALITTLPRDTDNVFVVLTARKLNNDLMIVSRCVLDSSKSKLEIAGADNVIMPDKVGGSRMAGHIINHNINLFIDKISISGGRENHIVEIQTRKLSDEAQNGSIGELLDKYNIDCLLIGLRRNDGSYVVNPDHSMKVSDDTELFFLGNTSQVSELQKVVDSSLPV